MTIGNLQTIKELNIAYNALKNMDETFTTMVNKISVEMIGKRRVHNCNRKDVIKRQIPACRADALDKKLEIYEQT